jgi:hypothetical protein
MRVLFFVILLFALQSCATKKYSNRRPFPDKTISATEEVYEIVAHQKKLLSKKQMVFTKNGRIKNSKTLDSLGKTVQETEKRMWFIVETYPDKEPFYCKTRWKPNRRERISCYSRKQYKQNEAIYHYNRNGTINKIVDNFETFQTQYYYYTNKELSKIVIYDKTNQLVDEILVQCETKDEKGTCLKETRISAKTNQKKEIYFFPK